MGSKSLNKKCKRCENSVTWSTKVCSGCGVKNPAVKVYHQLAVCGLVFLALTLWILSRDNATSANPVEVAKTELAKPNLSESIFDKAKVRSDLEDYKKKFSAAQNFWNVVDGKLASYSQSGNLAAAADLGNFMKLAQEAAETMAMKTTPEGPANVREQYQNMNDAIRGVFSYAEKRIRYSLEIVNGSGDPAGSAEKLSKAQTMHQYSVDKFNDAEQAVEKLLLP